MGGRVFQFIGEIIHSTFKIFCSHMNAVCNLYELFKHSTEKILVGCLIIIKYFIAENFGCVEPLMKILNSKMYSNKIGHFLLIQYFFCWIYEWNFIWRGYGPAKIVYYQIDDALSVFVMNNLFRMCYGCDYPCNIWNSNGAVCLNDFDTPASAFEHGFLIFSINPIVLPNLFIFLTKIDKHSGQDGTGHNEYIGTSLQPTGIETVISLIFTGYRYRDVPGDFFYFAKMDHLQSGECANDSGAYEDCCKDTNFTAMTLDKFLDRHSIPHWLNQGQPSAGRVGRKSLPSWRVAA